MSERAEHAALLSLMRWVSPALPVGAYAYSRGLEQAVTAGWVCDEASALSWISGLLHHGLARLDAPVLIRLHDAFTRADLTSVAHWNDYLAAARGSAELLLEDEQMGEAFLRLLRSLGIADASTFPASRAPGYVTAFALACVRSGVGTKEAVLGYLWSVCESQTSAAVRLIPLGQTAGQRIVGALARELPALVTAAHELADDELGSTLPALPLESARQETRHPRLFRS